jgi:multiple sugar transport system permease protein
MKLSLGLVYVVLIVYAFFTVFPVYWLVITSVKDSFELGMVPPTLFPIKPISDFYYELFTMRHFAELLRNSIIVDLATATIATLIGAMFAYGLSKLKILSQRPKNVILVWVLSLVMFPPIILAFPYFFMLSGVKLTNTLLGLIIVYLTFTTPFAVWTLKGFYDEYSTDIEEAAMVDGASRLQTFLRITIPVLLPAIMTVLVFCFVFSWQEFLYALILTNDYRSQTVTVGVFGTISKWEISWGRIAAAGTVASIPVIILFLILRRSVVRRMTFGVVKG